MRKLLSITVLQILLICSMLAVSISVCKAEFNIEDETLAIVNEVVCLDTEQNATHVMTMPDIEYRGLTQKRAGAPFTYDNGTWIRVECSFLNNNLRMIFISGYDFLVENFSISDTAKMAKDFLHRYQNYTGDSIYGEFASMLDGVNATEDTVRQVGNVKFEVNNVEQVMVDYSWRYVDDNGVLAKLKSVILSYDRGRFYTFLNNWPFFNVSGNPEFSAEEATEIAIEATKTYSYEATTDNGTETVTGFDIAPESLGHGTLSYANFPDEDTARDGDPFTLYPIWSIPIGFNKSYPNGVTGIIATIWADTGEIHGISPMVVVLVPEFPPWLVLPLFLVATVAVVVVRRRVFRPT